MSVTNGILIKPVGWWEVYDYMGLARVNGICDAGTACTSSLVNPESIIKPIKGNTAFYDTKKALPEAAWDDPNTSGWEVVQNGTINGQAALPCFNMRTQAILATDFKRMTDFNGYNKNAVGPNLHFDVSNISGYGQGSAFMGSGDTVLTLTAKVTFPTIRPGAVPIAPFNPSTGQNVQLVRYVDSNRIVVWELPHDPELPAKPIMLTAAQWAADYGGKTKEITITESSDLPVAGHSKDYTYYLEINGCHQRNGKVTTATARAWRQFQRWAPGGGPNLDLFIWVTPTKTENYGEIFYTSIERLEGRNTGNASDNGLYLRIRGLYNVGNPPRVDIYAGGTLIARCNNTTNVEYFNGAKVGWGNPQLNSYTYQMGSQTQTIQALDLHIRADSIDWNAAVELRSEGILGGE